MHRADKKLASILCFFMFASAVYAEGLTVNPEGDTGIGISEPLTKLHVNGPAIVGSGGQGTRSLNIVEYITGVSSNVNYIHLRLPLNPAQASEMFHIEVKGYSLYTYANHIINLTFAGYSFKNQNSVVNASVVDPTEQYAPAIYKGSDNHIYLRFKPQNTYYTSFVVDAIKVGNGRLFLPGDITVIESSSTTL